MTVLHRPASPLFVPKKHGVDKETQVEGDLFDFDFEVGRKHASPSAKACVCVCVCVCVTRLSCAGGAHP